MPSPPPKALETYTIEFEIITTFTKIDGNGGNAVGNPPFICIYRNRGCGAYLNQKYGYFGSYFNGSGHPSFMSKTFISDGKPHKIVMTIPRKYDAYYYIDGNFIYHLNTEGYYWKDRDDNTIYGYEKPSYINFSIYI